MFKKLIIFFVITILVLFTLFFINNNQEKITDLIPREIIFGNPDKAQVRISPNGKYLSFLAPLNGVMNIWIAPIENIDNAKAITNSKERPIRSYIWCYNNENILYGLDNDGDENFRIYSKNILNNNEILLTPEKGSRSIILQSNFKFPNEVIIGVNDINLQFFSAYRINVIDGTKELIFENNNYDQLLFDGNYNLRFTRLTNSNGDTEFFRYLNNELVHFMTVSFEDSDTTSILDFNEDATLAYLLDSRGRNTAAIKSLNLNSGEIKLLAENDLSDVETFTAHPTTNEVQIVSSNYDKVSYQAIDKKIENDLIFLKDFSESDLSILDRTLDDKIWVIAYISDNFPIKYYLYDTTSKSLTYLFTNSKELEKAQLTKMYPIIIKSRDGLDLVSYISFPRNIILDENLKPEANPLPMVLNVHGGPWARDQWGFSPLDQFLANRGYVVLNVNYRGSSGFGKNFSNASNLEWGLKMHDDLIDAVNWTVDNKIADKNRIVVMGGSYGGYAALTGITATPEVFAGAVDIVGPSNLLTLVSNFPPYWSSFIQTMKKRIGDWDTEEGKSNLMKVSPLFNVDKINKPLLIGQGSNDPRVTKLESDQIFDSMKKRGISVIYALYSDEGHGFAKSTNRISFYALTEQFLANVLGGKKEPIKNEFKNLNLEINNIPISKINNIEPLIDSLTQNTKN